MKKIVLLLVCFYSLNIAAQEIALIKYGGGGDWYANPTSLPNLIQYCNQNINTKITIKPATVEPGSLDLFSYPFVHLTGHGNVFFNDYDVKNLYNYLISGGFIHIDDNYGIDSYIRKEIKKVFPDNDFIELPVSHPIFQSPYSFPGGLPKIHEHDNKRPQAFGIIIQGRLVCLYTYECDLGDGWEDEEVHNDPKEIREKALKMGANIINYVFNN